MRITDRFRSEHQVFIEQLVILRSMLERDPSLAAFVAALRTLAAPLGRHAGREEAALFPALADLGVDAPVRVLTGEHRMIDGWIDRIVAGLGPNELRSVFAELESTLRGHIEREDEVLFPLAERMLGDERLAEMDTPAAVGR